MAGSEEPTEVELEEVPGAADGLLLEQAVITRIMSADAANLGVRQEPEVIRTPEVCLSPTRGPHAIAVTPITLVAELNEPMLSHRYDRTDAGRPRPRVEIH